MKHPVFSGTISTIFDSISSHWLMGLMNGKFWHILRLAGSTFLLIITTPIALADEGKAGSDISTFRTPLNNDQLRQLWEQYFAKPIFFVSYAVQNPFVPFCLDNNAIMEEQTGKTLIKLKIIKILPAPLAENQPGFTSYLYILSMSSLSSKFPLNSGIWFPEKNYDYITISVRLRNNKNLDFTSSDDIFFGGSVNFYSTANSINLKKITFDQAILSPAFGDSYPIAFGPSNQTNCPMKKNNSLPSP